jgi:hypothetical protein
MQFTKANTALLILILNFAILSAQKKFKISIVEANPFRKSRACAHGEVA